MSIFVLYPEIKFGVLIILFIFLFYLLFMLFNNFMYKEEPQQLETCNCKKETKQKETNIIDALELMKERNIISNKEFNELIVKAMPHIK